MINRPFGAGGGRDLPVPGDYDGDGKADLAVFRPDSDLVPGAAQWLIPLGGGGAINRPFGAGGGRDLPAPGDYDGDGKADLAVFRPESDLVPRCGAVAGLAQRGRGDQPALRRGGAGTCRPRGTTTATARRTW